MWNIIAFFVQVICRSVNWQYLNRQSCQGCEFTAIKNCALKPVICSFKTLCMLTKYNILICWDGWLPLNVLRLGQEPRVRYSIPDHYCSWEERVVCIDAARDLAHTMVVCIARYPCWAWWEVTVECQHVCCIPCT